MAAGRHQSADRDAPVAGVGRILVIDDEDVLQDVLGTLLRSEGYHVVPATTAGMGLERFNEEDVDLVLLDLMLPDRPGLEILAEIRAADPSMPVVIITAHSSVESAIEAMRAGAYHYVPKPFKNDEVILLVRRALKQRRLESENRRLRQRSGLGLGEMIGTSRAMEEIYGLIEQAAPARSNVLIQGESGTGKELVAKALHRLSRRAERPFIPVHTSAIPSELLESSLFGHTKGAFTGATSSRRGLFEAAHGGTLFLDEIGTLREETQAKLLRVLQERQFRRVGSIEPITVDVRLIAAANVDLAEEVEAGRFREDLYYRLNVINLQLPPLRNRREDIPLLCDHFLRYYAAENERVISGITAEALETMIGYRWPGNVRQLENAIERAVVLSRGTEIGVGQLPEIVSREVKTSADLPSEGLDFRNEIDDYRRRLLRAALERTDGIQRQAARLLNLSPATFNEMAHRLGVIGDGSS